MCGIVGQVRQNGPVDPALVERMCAALEHRGPDSRGTHVESGAGLGIQRLRVIDVEGGDQPIYSEDRSVAVVLNGEIYNFRELRERLERAGHTFRTEGDTEVIVHLYEEEGPGCVRSLDGMFAFALWDEPRRRLVVARDRVGKKPLFYSLQGGTLSFASEMAALLQDPDVPREVLPAALDCYLAFGYVPAPMTAFRGVHKLEPATTMVFENGSLTHERYWQLDYGRKLDVTDPAEIGERIREALRRAVRRRLISDVPLGAFLSGGIDSSAVVAAMAEATSQPVRTFSIGFGEERFNELPHARQVAEMFGTEHHEFVVEPDGMALTPKLVRHYGEPFADSSAIPSFHLAELTRKHVTVALNGDGGDESFAGYTRYAANVLGSRLQRLPAPVRRAGAAVAGRLGSNGKIDSTMNRARRVGESMALDAPTRYARYMAPFDDVARRDLYTAEYQSLVDESGAYEVIAGPWNEASGDALVDVMLEVDVRTYLPGDLLAKVDIATMAHSLEARSPFLDPELMQLAASIPAEMKLRGMEKKVVLRDALRGWIPDEILDRPKRGFMVPLVEWFRGELRDHTYDVLLDPVALDRGMLREDAVRGLLDGHQAGADHSHRIWTLLMLEMWQREFVDRAPELATPRIAG
ncbi:MAG TPA: asparagine synthase (glutamine-hydrolyzing) [Thermoleophilaceae bacterium]|nr:asparagine synthase (glutamine-hydrolyzing) [Thermoleophilaceae bacterium]